MVIGWSPPPVIISWNFSICEIWVRKCKHSEDIKKRPHLWRGIPFMRVSSPVGGRMGRLCFGMLGKDFFLFFFYFTDEKIYVFFFWYCYSADKEVGAIEQAHDSIVWTLAWHPLGHILCSGSNDHTSKFWTRNRPGDQMRDKYNLNTLPAGLAGIDDADIGIFLITVLFAIYDFRHFLLLQSFNQLWYYYYFNKCAFTFILKSYCTPLAILTKYDSLKVRAYAYFLFLIYI